MTPVKPEVETNLIEVLSKWSRTIPDKKIFIFFKDGETESGHFTFKTLDCEARKIAAKLQSLNLYGKNALLLYPSSLEFISAFFGCLYAGVIAVPAYPPQSKRHHLERLAAIVKDCDPKVILGLDSDLDEIRNWLTKVGVKNIQYLNTNNLESSWTNNWQQPKVPPDYLAFLQYTSGSTGSPKGVMVSHKNLLHNTNAIVKNNIISHQDETLISWLPLYHDLGLIGKIVAPITRGSTCSLMPPIAFLQQPYKWLHMISQHKHVISAAPNFAYELCIRRITEQQKKTLDLSSWKVAYTGAEPVRAKTLQQFYEAFASCGFDKTAIVPCYGLAEATLVAIGQSRENAPVMRSFVAASIKTPKAQVIPCQDADPNAKTLVSNGCLKKNDFIKIIIVDPETHTPCPNGVIGEIWLQSLSNALGYWNKTELSMQTFAAHTTENDQEKFLRTGDLGFIYDDEFFITGRLKELIIINGRNYYPQDIEYTVQKSHPALKDDAGAAFTIETDGHEQLVIVQEVERTALRNLDAPAVISAITQNISLQHELSLYACLLIKPATLPKTSSGKIQRRLSQEYFLQNKLKDVTIYEWQQASVETPNLGVSHASVSHASVSHLGEIQTLKCETPRLGVSTTIRWLQDYWSKTLHTPTVDVDTPFTTFGLSSLQAVDLAVALEQAFNLKVDPITIWEYPTIAKLSANLLSDEQQNIFPPITPASPSDKQVLSFSEQDCWHSIKQYNYKNPGHNIFLIFELEGNLSIELLEKSLNLLITQEESLRTCYCEKNGKTTRKIVDQVISTISRNDVSQISHEQIKQEIIAFQQQPFIFTQAPLLRLQLLRTGEKNYYLLCSINHMIADGPSVGILFARLAAIYQALQENTSIPQTKSQITFSDYATWQYKIIEGGLCQPQIKYWQQAIVNPETLHLPYKKIGPTTLQERIHSTRETALLASDIESHLVTYSKAHGVSIHTILLTAFAFAMKNFCQQDTVLFKGISDNRKTQQLLPIAGFVNNHFLVQICLKNADNLTFTDLVIQNHKMLLNHYRNSDVPFCKVLDTLRTNNPTLKINTFFNFHNYSVDITLPNVACKIGTKPYAQSYLWGDDVEIIFEVFSAKMTDSKNMMVMVNYPQQLFEGEKIRKLLENYVEIIEKNLVI